MRSVEQGEAKTLVNIMEAKYFSVVRWMEDSGQFSSNDESVFVILVEEIKDVRR